MTSEIRVRFAPSPTGFLHIGGVRTALFNYLFAQREMGEFLLRIEDTDRERSRPEFEQEILDSLTWLGLNWDGPILKQSERLKLYQTTGDQLIQKGLAYRIQEGDRSAVKFKVVKRKVTFDDLVHGAIEFDTNFLDDFIIVKSDGFPTYHFACIIDDHEMGITHIIRGDDHISNTPRQILLFEALGWKAPIYAHLPLVFGQDKTPLSKRHGAVALSTYRKQGYLPAGLLNYLALLGWSPGTAQEIFGLGDLIKEFQLTGINKTNACFDPEKLRWTNGEHLHRLTDQDYLVQMRGFFSGSTMIRHPRFDEIALLYKARLQVFHEFSDQASYFFQDRVQFDPKAVAKHFNKDSTRRNMETWFQVLTEKGNFGDVKSLEDLLRRTSQQIGVEAKELIHPTRVAISGRSVSPGLFEVMTLLGREVVLERIRYVIMHFQELASLTQSEE